MASQDEYQQQQFFEQPIKWLNHELWEAEDNFRIELENAYYKIDYTQEYIPINPREMTIGDDTLSKRLMTLDDIKEQYPNSNIQAIYDIISSKLEDSFCDFYKKHGGECDGHKLRENLKTK